MVRCYRPLHPFETFANTPATGAVVDPRLPLVSGCRIVRFETCRYDELPFLVCHLTLQTPDGQDAMAVESPTEGTVAMLYGSLATTPSEMLDQAGASGIYFAFPDISVRYPGRFRLQASLLRITGWVERSSFRSCS